jgi:demethylmenaquinone methyltransferase/2-methoxy-6-polyprenyl-1,4-benzoquinol methylase
MKPDLSQEALHCFARLAADVRWRGFTAVERRKVNYFARRWGIAPGERVLEPGCGAGRLTEILAERVGPDGGVMAFDASRAFMRLAAERRLPPWVTLRTGWAERL